MEWEDGRQMERMQSRVLQFEVYLDRSLKELRGVGDPYKRRRAGGEVPPRVLPRAEERK